MTVRAYYATHDTAAFKEGRVVLLDDEDERERGLSQTGYFEQLKTPEVEDAAEGEDRAR